VELHGVVYDGYLPCIRVLTSQEETALQRLEPSRPDEARLRGVV
jgi:hypothetical protein